MHETEEYSKLYHILEQNNINLTSLELRFSYSKNVGGWAGLLELEEQIKVYNIELFYHEWSESNEVKEIKIGYCTCYLFNSISPITYEILDVRDIADSISGDLLQQISPFVNRQGELDDKYFDFPLLCIGRLEIDSKYRRKGIGTIFLKYIIDDIRYNYITISVVPHPIEFPKKESETEKFKDALKEVTHFYEKLGFEKFDDKVWKLEYMPSFHK